MEYQAENARLRELARAYANSNLTAASYREQRRALLEALAAGERLPPPPGMAEELGEELDTLPNPTGTLPVLTEEQTTEVTVMQAALSPDMAGVPASASGDDSVGGWVFAALGIAVLIALAMFIVVLLL